MGHIKIGEEVIPDRRKNGARIKLDVGDWIKILSVAIALILAGGQIKWRVDTHSTVLAEQGKTLSETTKEVTRLQEFTKNIEGRLARMDSKLDRLLAGY